LLGGHMGISRRELIASAAGVGLSASAACAQSPKPFCNIGTIGHYQHGKTTLARAIAKSLGKAPPSSQPGALDHLEYATAKRQYAHVDCSGLPAFTTQVMAGMAQMDGAILVVSAADGPMPGTREHILLARQMGLSALVVFMSKADLVNDRELLELVELEMRELLSAYDFPGDKTPVIVGSARDALQGRNRSLGADRIAALMRAVDSYVPTPKRSLEKPFLMPVEDVFSISGRGVIVTGRVERGAVRVGDPLEIIGITPAIATTCIGVEMFRKILDRAEAGDNVGLLLSGVAKDQIERGQVLSKPGGIKAARSLRASVYMLTTEEGGRSGVFPVNYRAQFYFRTVDITGLLALPRESLKPGDNSEARVELVAPVPLEPGLRFVIRDAGKTVGIGVVTSIAPLAGTP
jgi:elongation factor Tu